MRRPRVWILPLLLASGIAAGQNLLTNPTFDSDVAGWQSYVQIAWVSDDGNPHGSGPGCIEITDSSAGGGWSCAFQIVPVTAGATYRLAGACSVPAGANGAFGAAVAVLWFDAAGTFLPGWARLADYDLDPAWAEMAINVTAPTGAVTAWVRADVGAGHDPTHPAVARCDDLYFGSSDVEDLELLVPAAASAGGAQGTYWTSELFVHNRGNAELVLSAALLWNEGDVPSVSEYVRLGAVGPGGTLRRDDVVAALGLSGRSGGLRLVLFSPAAEEVPVAVVSSRTSTPGASGGSYGQGIPARRRPPTGGVLAVPGLVQSSAFRTNVGVLNPNEVDVNVAVVVLDGGGGEAVRTSWTLGPYGHRQVSLASLGVDELECGTLLLEPEGDAAMLGYASRVDNTTGDAVYLEAERP